MQNPSPKSALRKQLLTARAALDPARRAECSRLIAEQLLADKAWAAAKSVMAYCSFPEEVATEMILARALRQGKRLLLPRCIAGENRFEAVEVRDLETDLAPTAFHGLVEPLPGLKGTERPEGLDMILVPGIAFDRRGFRIGFGAGMYDKFLSANSDPYRVALAFSLQVVEEVPIDTHDEPMHAILTEEGWIDTRALPDPNMSSERTL